MKSLSLMVVLAAALSGCAIVSPYEQPYSAYAPASPYEVPYPPAAVYGAPAPRYGYPIYVGPPVRFSFGLHFRSGRGHFGHHHHGFGGHRFRHGHFGGFRGHGFVGRGWRR